MAVANLITNKPATASDSYPPFVPSRAADGVNSIVSRWVSSRVPASLTVDMLSNFYVAQWNLSFMGALNSQFWPGSQYNMSDFKLQGSLDGANWFDMDTVTGNSANQISRSIAPRYARYLRVYVTKGLKCNTQVASLLDFQAYESPNSPYLSNLVPSVGSLNPAFNSIVLNYTMNVDNGVGNIRFTPSATQGNMTIKVNGTAVTSGQQSQQIDLAVGTNTVTVEVTSADGTMKRNYTISIIRAGTASYLSNLSIIEDNLELPVTLNPSFNSSTLSYTSTVNADYTSVKVTPSTPDSSATLKVNNVVVTNGQSSGSIGLTVGSNTITIQVITAGGTTTTYTVIITKTA